MSKIYGYCRISKAKQNIDRQERNILAVYPSAKIVKEAYTGTKVDGRKEFAKILKVVKTGDTIVFDSVSRMSRNAEEGMALYKELMDKGINLVFIKEPHINTDTYKKAFSVDLPTTDNEIANVYIEATKKAMLILAEEQIKIAFEQAEKEVQDLRQRTREGLETARLNGKQIGGVKGKSLTTKKSVQAKEQIKKYNKAFGGALNDTETIKQIGITRNTYYKYKKELIEEEV